MTINKYEIEFDGPYGPDEEFEAENKAWLCPENLQLLLREALPNSPEIKVREL